MSDIVERLRLQNDCLLGTGHDFSDVLLDAANEIERLRQRMQIMREWMLNESDEAFGDVWSSFLCDRAKAAEWFDEDGVPR